MWRYFANKCEIAYNLNQNFDCILFAAFAIESYVNSIFVRNGQTNHFDNLFRAASALGEEGLISADEQSRIESAFGKIRDYRNEIAHGRIDSILQERKKATIAYGSVVSLFSIKPLPAKS